MIPLNNHSALIIIDVQDGLDDPSLGRRCNPDAERNMARLLSAWRRAGRPIYHVQHMSTHPNSPLRPDKPGNAIKQIVAPQGNEPLIRKQVNNAFIGTDLDNCLREEGVQSLVIIGLTTDHCVSATARTAGDLGYATFVVADATAAHDRTGFDGKYYSAEEIHAVSLVSLQDEFATIITTAQVLASADE